MGLLDQIIEWFRELLIEGIMSNFAGMFDEVNQKAGEIASQVGQTPDAFDPGVFAMIRNLSDTAIIPIAGMILTFVLTYELIHMIIDRNTLHDFEPEKLYIWFFKSFCAVYILTHTFDIVMGVFGLAQQVVNTSAGVIQGSLNVGSGHALADLRTLLEPMGVFELIGLWLEVFVVDLCMLVMGICVFIIIYGRMIEIYLTVSIAPIPLATMANREWGQIGQNYLKSLFALAFQGFLIMVCVAIYAVLILNIPSADSAHGAIWGAAGYTVLLCFTLFKTGSLSKSLFGTHG